MGTVLFPFSALPGSPLVSSPLPACRCLHFLGPSPGFQFPEEEEEKEEECSHSQTRTPLLEREVSAHTHSPPLRLELYFQHTQPTAFFSMVAAASVNVRALGISWPHNPKRK